MRYIIAVFVTTMVLLDFFGGVPDSSVGGPLTIMFVALAAILATGLYEAWSQQRSLLGWLASIVIACTGGFLGLEAVAIGMEAVLPHLDLDGPLAQSHHPLRYVASPAMVAIGIAGAWCALQLVRRWR